jgi:hypothetical protein
MESSNVYVTIGLDKKGNVVEVRVDGRPIEPRQGPEGPLREGAGAPGCEEVVKRLVHELLTCRKKGSGSKPPPPPPVEDPCCYRDPQTGRVWCWC